MEKINLPQFLIDNTLHVYDNDGDIIVVDPTVIAKRENIDIVITDLSSLGENICGFIRKKDSKFQIFIEESHHKNRQRFTLAHELGHYFLHMKNNPGSDYFVDNKDTTLFRGGFYNKQEKEANDFAAEYLMPEEMVRKFYKKFGVTELLAKYFGVSRIAMAIRIDKIIGENE